MRHKTVRRTLKLLLGMMICSSVVGLVPVGLDPVGSGGVDAFAEGLGGSEGDGRDCAGVQAANAPLLSADIERKWGLDGDCDGPAGHCP